MAGAAPTNGGAAAGHYPPERAPLEVGLAWARPSPRREVTVARVCAARALGFQETESVSSRACRAGAAAAAAGSWLLSLFAVTVLRIPPGASALTIADPKKDLPDPQTPRPPPPPVCVWWLPNWFSSRIPLTTFPIFSS